ncbi:hypothetical protein K503DRAFT_750335 [Rhizopogon vinicolor AM-OR11-026]|uniref:Integral membrane protein n=1 Tax=Rhizopogon vinicolor AM-OR11-026 TaxID=1314800 RepID=A0A1B7MH57_9AGAM|nr:hypothetical protein K503DRAFT_750335 [Rhizopogon vinicolor AM-OR11-026]
MAVLYQSSQLVVVALVVHSIAILTTVFRLVYRGWTHHFWWEDGWAAFALISDVTCLACIWVDSSISSWTLVVAFTSVLWAARMSVIFSIIRIAKHTVSKVHRQVTYLTAASFACMWVAILVQKTGACHFHSCRMGKGLALSQLITDVVADVALVAVPLYLWKNVGLSRGKKIMVLSAFSLSILITLITIPHSIFLFRSHTHKTIIFSHVKAGLSLIICNLLVIVTFVYCLFRKETFDLDQSFESPDIFTTSIIIVQSGRTISSQIPTVQSGPTKSKMEDEGVICAEEGIIT